MKITGHTKITGIFGFPVEHTLSPAMHNAAFEDLRLDYRYVPFLVHPDELANAVKAIVALNLSGVNITIPHKEKIMVFLDEINEEASIIGAVNTVVNSNGRLIGYNTDGRGFMQSLIEKDIPIEGKDILIIGAGGAARSIGYYISQKANSLSIFGRTQQKVQCLVKDLNKFQKNVFPLQNITHIEKYHLIINTTPLGLYDNDPLPLDTSLLRQDQIVCDLIYKKTPLIQKASEKGCPTLDGMGMLIWQGALSFELWTGRKPDINVMRSALLAAHK
jgi:shikimate dehydrogenase